MNTQPQTTASIFPERFHYNGLPKLSRPALWALLTVILMTGFLLRTHELGRESLGEDEFNKLQTVTEYRTHGLTGRNGEHPFLMKGLQTASFVLAERWNEVATASSKISEEAALRFPTTLFGTFTSLLLFFLVSQLFGVWPGVLAAALWAVDPSAIGFDRIAKEDSFLLFFFLLANVLFVRSQTGAERGDSGWIRYAYISAFFFGSMVASKYLPHLITVSLAYNSVLSFPGHKWKLGRKRWYKFFAIVGIGFIVCNPTILLPQTWREMLLFGTENRIGHDSYEFWGTLYRNKMTAWLAGVPWYFYYTFALIKIPVGTLLLFAAGLPMMFLRRLGDGRYFIVLWAFMWLLPFTFLGGKFTRYFTVAEPLLLIVAALGVVGISGRLAAAFGRSIAQFISIALVIVVVGSSIWASVSAGPHYRLYVNWLGAGLQGPVFPHDEFYDASTAEIARSIASAAGANVKVANETPQLFAYYLRKAGRDDLKSVSLSDPDAMRSLTEGDFVVAARGRRYKSNSQYLQSLNQKVPLAITRLSGLESARVYLLDAPTAAELNALSR